MPYPSFHPFTDAPFIELQMVDSTNNYALARIHAGLAQHGTAIFAHEQVAGKGQRGKTWASPKGENIALSIIIKPAPLEVSQQFELSASIAIAAREFFSRYAGEDTKIKWPNDLYWKDRKAGGILIESIVRSGKPGINTWDWAVIGIGININQANFPPELPNPVSLKQITGKAFDPLELTKELYAVIDEYYQRLITKGFSAILPLYLSHFYKKDEKVKLKKGNRSFEAVIKSVSQDGKLIIQHGIEEQFSIGEIQWII
ncbi:MAG: biotin--[acetyl-CoA-carboxylase] ligase [Bacteroidota bacterium]|nr:biotin--[acetyl-CoA-carboxylase] ligase [Bacteroidota bacterium]